ncbi:T9SS type A sorting domain-containing protein [Flavobacterium psychrotrophum]|uniref:T9SS type A sorting domain-containing protein n=1 Tax=Flavobacterium psychrotrophum TaxID=2294119 RepID=UPI000E31D4E9|nr:T9SS type A sorting domain-containing protein [Flavobacterium psychrotrophum]
MKIYYTLSVLLLLAFEASAQVSGCTDPLSSNYNPNATVNDGSCRYASASVSATSSYNMPATVDESSGLVLWNGSVYTHNDDTDTNLYRISTINGEITQTLNVAGTANQDWEDIDQDAAYVYIGDFGNNVNGNRSNLRIIRVDKAGLLAGNPTPNNINFTYSNQTNFTPTGNNNTDFDCEAFVVGDNYIYLFTKQWVSERTSVYRLAKTPGTHTAELLGSYDIDGLITGATWLEDRHMVALCGYSNILSPFIYLLYDFSGEDFFGGNKRKIGFSESFTQVEAITTNDGKNYYLSNEHFQRAPLVNTTQKLFSVNLSSYLDGYLSRFDAVLEQAVTLYPNPAGSTVNLDLSTQAVGKEYTISDMAGKIVANGTLTNKTNTLDISTFAAGIYNVEVEGSQSVKLVKQ